MMLLFLLASAFLLAPWSGAGRIIGGWEAKPHSRPYMACLSSEDSYCGAFLIRQDAVLSAAHCVAGKTKVNITVTLGAHNTGKKEPSQQTFHIGHWVIHPIQETLQPDAKLNKKVRFIPLPYHNEDVLPGTLCKVAGWGNTSTTGNTTSVLMEVDLKVRSEEMCEMYFKKDYLQQSMICAGDENGKKSAFHGVSGGPLVCNGKAHGIVSYGHKYCIWPTVFTRVSYFEPWICEELRKFVLQDLPDSLSSD
ncbi:duodenase-1-like [Morus bassanus]